MAQVPGLGLDQSQLSDIINQQYKGYSQKQRNQMTQSASASPDNWTSITQQSNQQANSPSEFLGAGRQTDIPRVSQNGEVFAAVSPDQFSEYSSTMPEFGKNEFAPTYENEQAKYYNSKDLSKVNTLAGAYDYLKKINPLRTKTETWNNTTAPDRTQGWKEMQGATDEYGNTSPSTWTRQVQDTPLTYTDFMNQYGVTPEGGWTDANTKGRGLTSLFNKNGRGPLQQWMKDESLLPTFSLLGSGSPEDMQKGFNVLQRMSPQNIGEFWSLSPDVQKGMLADPAAALQQMRATANPANKDWLSVGAEGGFNNFSAYGWDPKTGLTLDKSQYMNVNDGGGGLLGGIFGVLDPVLDKLDPMHNTGQDFATKLIGADTQEQAFSTIAPMVLNYFLPGAGSALSAADAASTGNWTGALTNAAGAYIGATGGIDTGYGATANAAANGAASSAINSFGQGGDLADMFKAAAMGGLGGAAGSGVGKLTSNLSPTLSGFLSGAARGATSSLLQPQNMLESALSSGAAGGLGGMFNNGVTDKTERRQNSQNANNLVKLAKLFVKK